MSSVQLLEMAQAGASSMEEAVATVAAADDLNCRDATNGNTPLLWAAYFGEAVMIQALFGDERCDRNAVNDKGMGALHQAAVADNADALKLLLQLVEPSVNEDDAAAATASHGAGAGAGAVASWCSQKNQWGETPLHLAAAAGHRKCVEALLAARADPCAKDNWGRTPVDVGAESGGVRLGDVFSKCIEPGSAAETPTLPPPAPPPPPPLLQSSAQPEQSGPGAAVQGVLQKEFMAMLARKSQTDGNGQATEHDATVVRGIFKDQDFTAPRLKPALATGSTSKQIANTDVGLGRVVNHPAATDIDAASTSNGRMMTDRASNGRIALAKKVEYPGSLEAVEALLADPTIDPRGKDMFGWTALHKFCCWDQPELVLLLLDALDASDLGMKGGPSKQTPLEAAEEAGASRAAAALRAWTAAKSDT